jgi:nucleoside-diphosphate-sugar epimerase
MTAPQRVAVLGAAGCLGRQISAALRDQGDEVVAMARHPSALSAPYRFIPVDVARRGGAELARLFTEERVDVVVNAIAGWGRTEEAAHEGNIRPVDQVLDALRRLPTGPRLVQIGTIHEYGPVAEGTSIREDTEARPQSVYATAKLVASQRVLAAIRDGGVRGVVVRVANTYGPHPAVGSFLGSLAVKLRGLDPSAGLDLTIAEARRDYVDVRDAVDAILRAIRTPAADPLVNIGRGEAVDMRTLVRALVQAAGLPRGTVREKAGEVSSLGGDWTRFDISRARELLNWRPRFGIDESMRAMWDSLGTLESEPALP